MGNYKKKPMTIEKHLEAHFKLNVVSLPFTINHKSFKKNEIITKLHSVENKVYFLKSGVVEFRFFDGKKNKIVDFFFENNFFCALTSLILQKTTEVEIRTLTDCEVEYINYSEIQSAYSHSLLANQIGRLLVEQAYILKHKREKDFLTYSALERYQEIIKTRPEIVKEIPIHKIADYLGIHPESLSRIRKLIS